MDRTTNSSSYRGDYVIDDTDTAELIDTESPLPPPPPPPPLLPGEGLRLPDGPHNATASVLEHRMMTFTDQQHPSPTGAQHGTLPDLPLEHATQKQQHHTQAPGALPLAGTEPRGAHRHQDHGLQTFPTLPSSALQARPDWFLFNSSASNPSAPFLQPIDPFLTHPGTNIVDFGLGISGEDFTTTPSGTSITPLPPLSGSSSTFDFDFDFNSPLWEPSIGDGLTLSPGIGPMPRSGGGLPDTTEAYSNIPGPSSTTVAQEQRHRDPSWLDDDDLTSSRELHSSHSSRGATSAGRRRQKKGKTRDDSTTASGSARSASIASTQDIYPFPDPTPNPSNPLIPSSGSNRRRSTRTKTRAKSVATTTSASSSSTAPTPSSVSATSVAGPSNAAAPPAPSTADTPRSSSAAAAAAAANQSRLRSASRASKNSVNRPSDTPEERRTRASHNLVEKQYRSRLNAQFEGLLSSLPDLTGTAGDAREGETTETASPKVDGGAGEGEEQGERKVSKAEVLERARLHIETLERESEALRREREELLASLLRAESEMVSGRGEGLDEFLRRSGGRRSQGHSQDEEEEEYSGAGVKRE